MSDLPSVPDPTSGPNTPGESCVDASSPLVSCFGSVFVLLALAHVVTTLGTVGPAQVYRKDLLQDYLAARAVLKGEDPYQPMKALRAKYVGRTDGILAFPHPTPHPPPALLLTLPLGLTTYPVGAAAWLTSEYILLGLCAILGARCVWGTQKPRLSLAFVVLALATRPVVDDLVLGQFSVVLLTLLTGAYLALRGGRRMRGGLLLGAAVSLKFLGWPLILFYAWKRQGKVVLCAALAFLALNAASAVVMPGAIAKYYREIAPRAGGDYAASDLNISVWTLGQRIFGGLYSQATTNAVTAPPLIDRPELASRAGGVMALATFLIFLVAAVKLQDENDGFLVMLSVSTVLNPIAWEIYLTLLLLPLAVIGHRLAQRSWPPRPSLAFAGLVGMLIALKIPHHLALGNGDSSDVSALRALLTIIPLLWPLTTAWAVARMARLRPDSSQFTASSVDLA